jgi:hypothetical protein
VTIDDVKLAELLAWCETAGGCRIKTDEDIARLFRYKGPD